MYLERISRLLIALLLAFGCARTQKTITDNADVGERSNRHLSEVEVKEMNKNARELVSKRLKQLSVAAKAGGEDKVRFLASDMFLKGSAALMEGDYQTANLLFENFLELEPNDDFVKKKYAISLIRAGEVEKSEQILISLFKNSKQKDEKIGLVLAGVHASLGKVKQSRRVYSKLLKLNPKNEEACIFLGKSYALEKKTTKAVSLLKSCEKRDPKKGIYSYYIGKIFVDKKQFKTARSYFRRSVKKDPSFTQGVMALGLIYEELGEYKRARKIYKEYLKKDNKDALILSRLVQLMFTHEEFKDVVPYAERLAELEPENLNLKVKLGILYTDVKDYPKAISTFKELLRFAPDNDKMLYYLGAIYQETNELESAISVFTRIKVKSGLYQDSSLQIANMLSKLAKREFGDKEGKSKKQEKRLISFIDTRSKLLEGSQVDFSVIKATFFEVTKRRKQAIRALREVQDAQAFTNEHKFYLASLYEKEKSHVESIKIIEQIVKAEPKNAHAWNFLGYSFVERGENLDLAYEYINKAIRLSPEDGYIRDSLGWYYYKVGKLARALNELKRAIKVIPTDVSVNKHLAIVYIKLNKLKLAKKYVSVAMDHAEEEVERNELHKVLRDLEANRVPASFGVLN